jgi:hypothetical protein
MMWRVPSGSASRYQNAWFLLDWSSNGSALWINLETFPSGFATNGMYLVRLMQPELDEMD